MTYDEAVGLAVYVSRRIRGVSQPELAEVLEVTPFAVSRIESGTTKMTVVHLRKIGKRLRVSASEIVEDAERYFARSKKS